MSSLQSFDDTIESSSAATLSLQPLEPCPASVTTRILEPPLTLKVAAPLCSHTARTLNTSSQQPFFVAMWCWTVRRAGSSQAKDRDHHLVPGKSFAPTSGSRTVCEDQQLCRWPVGERVSLQASVRLASIGTRTWHTKRDGAEDRITRRRTILPLTSLRPPAHIVVGGGGGNNNKEKMFLVMIKYAQTSAISYRELHTIVILRKILQYALSTVFLCSPDSR